MVRLPEYYCSVLLLIFSLFACQREVIGPQASQPGEISDSRRVLIINEGNFQQGNASIGYYNSLTNSYSGGIYARQNGSPIGDVLESVYYENDKFYAILNGSNRVLICDSSCLFERSFEALGTPRYMALAGDRIYLSDLYKSEIGIYDGRTLDLQQVLNINKPAFALKSWQDKIIVAAGKELRVYDPQLPDSIKNTISLPAAVKAILDDGRSKLIIVDNNRNVYRWESPQDSLITIGTLSENSNKFMIDYRHDEFYSLAGSEIFVYSFFANSLVPERSFTHAATNVYGMTCDSIEEQLYIMDPEAFVAPSSIYIYDRLGALKDQFSAGFISNGTLIRD
jgi:hypothetical protein